MMSPKKEMGPTMAVATADAESHAQQQAADAAVVVHAEVDGLLLAQCQHIQQGQFLAQSEDDACQKNQGKDDNLGIDIAEACHRVFSRLSYSLGSMTRVRVV